SGVGSAAVVGRLGGGSGAAGGLRRGRWADAGEPVSVILVIVWRAGGGLHGGQVGGEGGNAVGQQGGHLGAGEDDDEGNYKEGGKCFHISRVSPARQSRQAEIGRR